MGDGIQWLVGETTSSGWTLDVHFARAPFRTRRDPLPVYAIMGSPAPDLEEISAWAAVNEKPLPAPHLRLVPADLREEYERAPDPDRWRRHTRHLPARAQWSPRA
ncbi:hypothetical protein OG601_26205 [Streptomyces sp. NBC_01239]|uniref:hypothetical protein n=1 Tax=Streptomyces sp. NBC_01239 TaxID=2903792 RepID=UPI00225236D4|nr:hypothetical protein [Streptomyces sp. NBC_01239]MCX4814098.1 hypothetical protein [Streptomyces sp. NBC_01239]